MGYEILVQEYLDCKVKPGEVAEVSDDSEIEALDTCSRCGQPQGLYFMFKIQCFVFYTPCAKKNLVVKKSNQT